MQFGTNFVGHFLLTSLLLPRLLEGAPARVVNVSSSGHLFGGIRWDDINFEKGCYDTWESYGQSKSANILHAIELTRRYKDQGVIANSLHPGYIHTELQRHGLTFSVMFKLPTMIKAATKYSSKPKTPGQGAATTMYAALSPDTAEGGKFYDDCQERDTAKHACDPEEAKKLWEAAEKWVNV